jgi:hypothetical protein
MRATVVAGIGGLVIGHVLWLAAISFAIKTTTVNGWVLVISAAAVLLAVVCGLLGWTFHRRQASAKTAFLWCLPAAPIVFTICVLGVTYV